MQTGGGLNRNGGTTTANPRLHEGDQPWGTVHLSAYNPCPVDDVVNESTTAAELIIFDVGNSETTKGTNMCEFLSKCFADLE